ncbi:MAG: DUF4190 domain-containing protein [Ignavibacteriales bacterium]|nr:DUF4190 domain-containing protein [Ignavibacteriales bacterium]
MSPSTRQPTVTAVSLERGRGALVLVLGILSLVMFGLITGIPAWVMGHADLKRMKDGLMESTDEGLTRAGMILGIIGTMISGFVVLVIIVVVFGIAAAVGLALFEAKSLEFHKEAVESEIYTLAEHAYAYRLDTGSYEGYEIPVDLKKTENASYSISIISSDRVSISARARNRRASIEATLNANGRLVDWIYRGAFSENEDHNGVHSRIQWRIPRSMLSP